MANGQHGGHRRPNNPAPVSGPGALSARTDGGAGQPIRVAPGGEYGSRREMEAIQGGAPMADNSADLAAARSLFGSPSARPDEPVTSGADAGAGLSMAGAGIQGDTEITNEQLRPLIRSLELVASLPGSNPETRTFVRMLKARLSG